MNYMIPRILHANELDVLIGKTIHKIYLNKERDVIAFVVDGEPYPFMYYAEGDCCSNSWFEHIDNVPALIDAIVTAIDSEHGDQQGKHGDDVIEWDFIKITTHKGKATLEFRNQSNGYYGGWLERITDQPKHRFNDYESQLTDPNKFKDITEDF